MMIDYKRIDDRYDEFVPGKETSLIMKSAYLRVNGSSRSTEKETTAAMPWRYCTSTGSEK